jgi:hypothetical protein
MRNYEAEATMHDVARMYDRLAGLAANRKGNKVQSG